MNNPVSPDVGRPPLILVVEDELMIASFMEVALQAKGYRVLGPVATVEDAVRLLSTSRPDLALIDYRLANATTEPLLPELQARGVKVCVMTGYSRSQLPAAYAGYPVLEKPFLMSTLLQAIADIL